MRRSAKLLIPLLAILVVAAGCSRGRNDQAITTDIQAKMFAEPQLKAANLQITTQKGEVTLSGEVPSDAARYAAFKLATDTLGVTRVNDRMSVKMAEATPPPPEAKPEPPPAPRRLTRRAAAPASTQTEMLAPPPPPAAAPAAAAPQPRVVEIPAGSTVSVRMIDSVDSAVNHSGEIFRASLDAPLVVDNEVVVPAGNDVFVKLVDVKSAGRISGRSELRMELVRMQFQGKSYVLQSSTYEQAGTSRGKRTAAMAGGGAGLGALIGAVAGGGKGAAIGAAVGAAAGTGVQVATKGQQIKIPSETKLDFRLEQPVEISYFPGKNKSKRATQEPD